MLAEYILYILCIAALAFAIWAQIKVQSTFNKYSTVHTRGGTAASVARRILDGAGLFHVAIERIHGSLTDHYDPRAGVLRLSQTVYDSTSAAAVGVAAHECGHAIQHAAGYFPLRFRGFMAPVVSFASRFNWILIMLGAILMSFGSYLGYHVVLFGLALFLVITVFQLVTLPCEFDASRRALAQLTLTNSYTREELAASRKVLFSAALTYVAALLVSLLQMLRLAVRFLGRGRRR